MIEKPMLLAVDDKPDNLAVLRQVLAGELPEADVLAAGSCEEGLALARQRPIDCALIDVQMPGVDGVEMCRRLKAAEATAQFPVILITAHASTSEFRTKALEAGANDFVSRPIDNHELAARIRVMLRIKRAEDELRQVNARLEELVAEKTQALAASEARYRDLYDNAPDMFVSVEAKSARIAWCNETVLRVTGYSREEIVNRPVLDLYCPDCLADAEKAFGSFITTGEVRGVELAVRKKDGGRLPVSLNASAVRDEQGVILYSRSVLRDISDRERAQEALRHESAMRRILLENLPCIAMVLKKQTREIVYSNEAARQVGAVPGRTCYGTCARRDDACPFCLAPELWATGSPQRLEVEHAGKWYEGRWVPLTDDLYVHYIFDIDHHKRTEEELTRHRDHLKELVDERSRELAESRARLQRSERLVSIGTLAAGLAHEINNPLGMVLLSTDVAIDCLGKPEELGELLRQQKRDVERCSRIVKGVLDFARQRSTERQPLDLNEAVRMGLDFTREYAREHGVAVEARLADTLGPILGNSTELEQVVVNLVHNAVHACGAGGRVAIETQAAGDRVRLVVRDDGYGMTPEQIEHIFDPFYTTRLEKGGTGLGLSTVHGIVARHEGTIDIRSEPGKGAVFTVEFSRHVETGLPRSS